MSERYPDKPRTYLGRDGWTHKAPITDERCILVCLKHSLKLDGMDKKQVAKLVAYYQLVADALPDPPLPDDNAEYDGHN